MSFENIIKYFNIIFFMDFCHRLLSKLNEKMNEKKIDLFNEY